MDVIKELATVKNSLQRIEAHLQANGSSGPVRTNTVIRDTTRLQAAVPSHAASNNFALANRVLWDGVTESASPPTRTLDDLNDLTFFGFIFEAPGSAGTREPDKGFPDFVWQVAWKHFLDGQSITSATPLRPNHYYRPTSPPNSFLGDGSAWCALGGLDGHNKVWNFIVIDFTRASKHGLRTAVFNSDLNIVGQYEGWVRYDMTFGTNYTTRISFCDCDAELGIGFGFENTRVNS